MAVVAVGGAFLSATLRVLFDRMASPEVLDFIREEKEITNPPVKKWLDDLRDAVCVAEDLLDEIATEALQCQLEAKNKYGGALKDSVYDRMEFFVEEMLPKETWKSAHPKFLVMYLLNWTNLLIADKASV